MIHDLKPYPAVKDSGVPWLGPVPEHWDVSSSKWLFKASKELARPDDVQLSATQAYGVIPQAEYERRTGSKVVKISMHLDKRKHVEQDDFVISMRSFQGGLERAWASGAIRSSYVILKSQEGTDVEFYTYLFKSHDYIKALQATAGFIRDGQDLTEGNFRQVPLPLPPLADQKAIGSFLAHADRRIRKAIAAKQRLIKLLQEQKQVIIHQAVTRGLDPNVKLKPSGVEWLGDVPEGWETISNRLVFRQRKTLVGKRHGDYTLLSLTLTGVIPRDLENAKGKFPTDFDTYQEVRNEQMVMCLFDVDETPRTVGLSQIDGMITGAYDVFDISNSANSRFVYYWYLSLDNMKGLRPFYSGLRKVVPRDTFMSLKMFSPPLDEQQAIVHYIETETAKLDQAIARAQAEISLLREYRTRLIADVVTGKLDVRGAAARLPEPEQDALPDELDAGEDEGLEGEEEGTGEEE